MRYYVYISDAKIDMLFPQISKPYRKRITREVGVDWKVLTAKQTTEMDPHEHRTHRLAAVEAYLRENEAVGTVSDPQRWIGDQMMMHWGPLDRSWVSLFAGSKDRNEDNTLRSGSEHLAWFAGISGSGRGIHGRCVGLGGSASHVVGGSLGGFERTPVSPGMSLLGSISSALLSLGGALQSLGLYDGRDLEHAEGGDLRERMEETPSREDQLLLAARMLAKSSLGFEAQRLEFLAKRLVVGTAQENASPPSADFDHWAPGDLSEVPTTVVIGTPLYVALVD